LGYTFNKRATNCKAHRDREESKEGSGMCLGNRREKVGRWFQEENDVWERDRECMEQKSGKGRNTKREESARKFFERGARRRQRNARLHSEGIV
jgi:hypothetical protein